MTEFFRPGAKEKVAHYMLEQAVLEYGVSPKRNVKDTAHELMNESPKLRDAVLESNERALLFLSQVSVMVDPESRETEYFEFDATPYERNNAFFRRIEPKSNNPYVLQELGYFVPHSVHEEETEICKNGFQLWGEGSFLHEIREEFGITPDNEKPYNVVVTDLDRSEFIQHYKVNAFVSFKTEERIPIICLPKGIDESTVAHEYLHGQHWLFPDYIDLGRGLEEGIVESHVPMPIAYKEQRDLVSFIDEIVPEAGRLIVQSRNNPEARINFFRILTDEFGLNGLNYIMRASADPYRKAEKLYAQDMYTYVLPPQKVVEALKNIKRIEVLK